MVLKYGIEKIRNGIEMEQTNGTEMILMVQISGIKRVLNIGMVTVININGTNMEAN